MVARWGIAVCAFVQAEGFLPKDAQVVSAFVQGKQESKNPGAGVGDIEAFQSVFKDGYSRTECVKDSMFHYGDRYGNNKDQYKLGSVANVSIVHYSEVVPKLDRKRMTPNVCFDFCRSVPNMDFFGIRNGRDCYCEPYYTAAPSDSAECEEVCEGDHSQTCGGKDKSAIFAMHMGANAVEDMESGVKTLNHTMSRLTELYDFFVDHMQKAKLNVVKFETSLAEVQDFAATNMLQKAWNQAYDMKKLANAASAVVGEMKASKEKTEGMLKSDAEWTDYESAKKAEDQVAKMRKVAQKGQKALDELEEANEIYKYMSDDEIVPDNTGRAANYYHAYYFAMDDPNSDPHTEKNWGMDKSTCSGESISLPIFGMDEDSCAFKCDATEDCVAYQFYSEGTNSWTNICLLMSHVDDVSHYDACHPLKPSCAPPPPANKVDFLQKRDSDPAPFVWKKKSTEPNSTLFADAAEGLCTEVHGCEGEEQAVADCDLMKSANTGWGFLGAYQCIKIQESEVTDDGDSLTMKFAGWVPPGQRESACKTGSADCGSCKKFSSCAGPYAETEPLTILKDNVAKYSWSSSGQVDNYEVFVGLYSETCGLVDYQFQRGAKQEMREFELFAPITDQYYIRFMLGSYDATGKSHLGADMTVVGAKRDHPSRPPPRHQAKCMMKFNQFNGMDLRPKENKNCKYCFQKVEKKCLKPDGSFPHPNFGPNKLADALQ